LEEVYAYGCGLHCSRKRMQQNKKNVKSRFLGFCKNAKM